VKLHSALLAAAVLAAAFGIGLALFGWAAGGNCDLSALARADPAGLPRPPMDERFYCERVL
jgi:hypothetical protein